MQTEILRGEKLAKRSYDNYDVTVDDIDRLENYVLALDKLWEETSSDTDNTLKRRLFAESQLMTNKINRIKKFSLTA